MIIRTVLGDVTPHDLGITYAHEHLIIDSPTVAAQWPHIHLPSVDEAVAETLECIAAGVSTMVDAMPTGSGRSLSRLADVSRASGMNIIASTGMHTSKYYAGVDWAHDDVDALAARFVSEIVDGKNGIRTGILKVATSSEKPNARELSLFEAAGKVHHETGVPVLTHCEDGRGAMAQVELLCENSIPLSTVIISHTDKIIDRRYHTDLLEAGVNLEYDQALRQHLVGDASTAELIAAIWEDGHGSQILLGTDGARRSLWTSLGGAPGLHWLATGFPAVLASYGIGEEELHVMLTANPARVLAFDQD